MIVTLDDRPLAAEILAPAIALDPDRPEAYFARALYGIGRSPETRMADLDAARDRGLDERTYHMMRGIVLAGGAAPRGGRARGRSRGSGATVMSARGCLFPGARLHGPRRPQTGDRVADGGDRREHCRRSCGARPICAAAWRAKSRETSRGRSRTSPRSARAATGASGSARTSPRSGGGSIEPDRAEAQFSAILADLRERSGPESCTDLCGSLKDLRESDWWDRASEEAARLYPDSGVVLLARAEFLEETHRHAESCHLSNAPSPACLKTRGYARDGDASSLR